MSPCIILKPQYGTNKHIKIIYSHINMHTLFLGRFTCAMHTCECICTQNFNIM